MTRTARKVLLITCFFGFAFCCLMLYLHRERLQSPELFFTNPAAGEAPVFDPAILKIRDQLKVLGSATQNKYDPRIIFMIDMSIPSGKPRFFVYHKKKDSLLASGLVTHGYGSITGTRSMHYSNVAGSNCTSLGKYKIGKAYQGRFGLAYKLHGLDKTNNNAFARFVVLHAHECVPDKSIYPEYICASQGCPTVSPGFLQTLKGYIEKADKPILLWIYDR